MHHKYNQIVGGFSDYQNFGSRTASLCLYFLVLSSNSSQFSSIKKISVHKINSWVSRNLTGIADFWMVEHQLFLVSFNRMIIIVSNVHTLLCCCIRITRTVHCTCSVIQMYVYVV